MDNPATYRIQVDGVVPERWLERLGGMRIVSETADGVALEGWVPDQAALAGVLNTLVELHLTLREVSRLRDRSGSIGSP